MLGTLVLGFLLVLATPQVVDDARLTTFSAPVDHFDPTNKARMRIRYWIDDSRISRTTLNDKTARPKGCQILYMVGGESGLSEDSGIGYSFVAQDLAKELENENYVILVETEHRYYGKSLPGPLTIEDILANSRKLKFLTVEQTIRDNALLISELKSKYEALLNRSVSTGNMHRHDHYVKCNVMTIGGSYPGFLAGIMRLRYPSLVDIGYASSAPFTFYSQENSQYGYYKVISEAAERISPGCFSAVQSAFNALSEVHDVHLLEALGICPDSARDIPEDILRAEVVQLFRIHFANMNMGAYPPQTSLLKKTCQVFIDAGEGKGLQVKPAVEKGRVGMNHGSVAHLDLGSLAGLRRIVQDLSPSGCLNLDAIKPSKGTFSCGDMSGCGKSLDGVMWDFQTCTELVEFIGTNNHTDMFPARDFSLKWLQTYCSSRFPGITPPQPDLLHRLWGFDTTKLKEVTSYILFTNGENDGWSSGSVLKTLSPTLKSLVIPTGAHHSEMKEGLPEDSHDMLKARKEILRTLKAWVKEKSGENDGGFSIWTPFWRMFGAEGKVEEEIVL